MYGDGWAHIGLYTGSRAPFSSHPILSRSRGHKASTCLTRPTIVTSTASTMLHTVWSALYTYSAVTSLVPLSSEIVHIFFICLCLHIKIGQHVDVSVRWLFYVLKGDKVHLSLSLFIHSFWPLASDLLTGFKIAVSNNIRYSVTLIFLEFSAAYT